MFASNYLHTKALNIPNATLFKCVNDCLTILNENVTLIKNSSGLYSFSDSFKPLISKEAYFDNGQQIDFRAVMKLLTLKRSELYKGTCTQITDSRYATGTPLVLLAFKKNRNIKYSEWDFSDSFSKHCLDVDSYDLVQKYDIPDWSASDLLQFRSIGSTIKSGPKVGQIVKPTSRAFLSTTGVLEFDQLPSVVKACLTQIWVFHSSIRNSDMITCINDVDSVASALDIASEVLRKDEEEFAW